MQRWLVPTLAAAMLAACNPLAQTEGAREQVDLFHERLNAGDDDRIWAGTGKELRNVTSREEFVRLLGTMRKSLGDVEETSQTGFRVNTTPQGTFTALQMNTHFEHGRGVETFVFSGSGDKLKLVSYNINSPDMMSDMMESYAEKPANGGETAKEASQSGEATDPPTLRIPQAEQ